MTLPVTVLKKINKLIQIQNSFVNFNNILLFWILLYVEKFVLHNENTLQAHIFQRISSISLSTQLFIPLLDFFFSRKHSKCSFSFPCPPFQVVLHWKNSMYLSKWKRSWYVLGTQLLLVDDIFYYISYFSIIFRIVCTLKNYNLNCSSIFPTGQSTVATKTWLYYFVEASCTHVF
jgi:hypothetical protein